MKEYNPENQYRCTIIRGKSQSEMEDLLPYYAQVIHRNCPCTKEEFDARSNNALAKYFFGVAEYGNLPSENKKTVRNHVTEIMGKLLGLYYFDADDCVHESASCAHLHKNHDFPIFFKNLCFNLQFPNGSANTQNIQKCIADGLSIRPICFVVSLLLYASERTDKLLTKQEIGYYALNNLDVLRGEATEKDVFNRILADRKAGVRRPQLSGSHDWQHIKEMLNLMILANLVCADNEYVWLNKREVFTIDLFAKHAKPGFDAYGYSVETAEHIRLLKHDWQRYNGSMVPEISSQSTTFAESAGVDGGDRERGAVGVSTIELGDEGEALVYRMEKQRIGNFKQRLVNKVILLGKTKGLGYDIASLEADEDLRHPEYARYIEVKSTRRVTKPSFDDKKWSDTLNLTSKEWIAAEQYGKYYNIYRVYFTRQGNFVVKINNPFKLQQDGVIEVFPTNFQMVIGGDAISGEYEMDGNGK